MSNISLLHLTGFPLIDNGRLAQATCQIGIVSGVGLQPRNARELQIIDTVAQLIHAQGLSKSAVVVQTLRPKIPVVKRA